MMTISLSTFPARWIMPMGVVLLLALGGCTEGAGAAADAASIAADEAAAPTMEDLAADGQVPDIPCFDVVVADGAVHLLLGREDDEAQTGLAFYYTRSEDGGESWSEPMRVETAHAPPGRHHRGNDPQLAVRGDRVMALWTARGGGPFGSGPLAIALSDDGGRTWRAGPSPSAEANGGDGAVTGYRFPAVVADDAGFHVVWIHAVRDHRSLRHARLDFDVARWSEPTVIDATACACCWNRMQVGPDGALVVLYRDEQPRDMGLAVSDDRGRRWVQTGHVGRFGWQFDGCPHVGGGLAVCATGRAMWATVWTGHGDHVGAYVLNSPDGGDAWSPSSPLGANGKAGRHTDLAAASASHVAAAWDQSADDGGQAVFVIRSTDGGATWSEAQRLSPPGRRGTHPRLVVAGDRFLALWSESGAADETPALRVQAVEVAGEPASFKGAG